MNRLDTYPIIEGGVIGRILNSQASGHTEAVIVLPSSGKIDVLNEVGARIWSLVDGCHSVREIASVVCAEYQVELALAEADTISFLEDLSRRGAIAFRTKPNA